jgi:hypothetical protein
LQWCGQLGEHSNTLLEETVVFRGDNEDYKRKAEQCYEQFFQLEEACEIIKYIFDLSRDRLDTIEPSIGAAAITPDMHELLEALQTRCTQDRVNVLAIWKVWQTENAIATLYHQYVRTAIEAKDLVNESNTNVWLSRKLGSKLVQGRSWDKFTALSSSWRYTVIGLTNLSPALDWNLPQGRS